MTVLLKRERYKNELKVAHRNEYNKYIVTVLNRETNEVYGSVVGFIDFELEDAVLPMLLNILNDKFPLQEDKKEFYYIEHAHCTLLNRLENEHIENQYLEQVIIPFSQFRALSKNKDDLKTRNRTSNWIQKDLPNDVDIVFCLIDGHDQYYQAIHNFEQREKDLRDLFDKDFLKASGLDVNMFKFLTKSISTDCRESYMNNVTEKVNEYLDLLKA